MRTVSFKWVENLANEQRRGKQDDGFIAQEIEEMREEVDEARRLAEEWEKFDQDILVISAVSGDGLETLISTLSKAVQ